jgi:diguanylate cyclase (GGDEF)-like protein
MTDLGAATSASVPKDDPAAPSLDSPSEMADDSPGLRRRARLAVGLPLRRLLGGSLARQVVTHPAADAAASAEAMGIQRAIFWLRLLAIGVVLALTPFVSSMSWATVVAGIFALAATTSVQAAWFRARRPDLIWAIAAAGLIGDSLTGYLIGQAFVDTNEWIHFVGYPLLALEGAVVIGPLGAALSTAASAIVFTIQQGERLALGHETGLGVTIVVVGVFAIFGIFSASYAGLTRRMRGDLQALLAVSRLLSEQETPTRIVQALDTRLRELVGARVRSVAVRRPDGSYEVLRWRTPETRVITTAAIRRLSAHLHHDVAAEIAAGRAITVQIRMPRDEPVTTALGLPGWVRAITLVPIASDGHLSGILPVLWDSPRQPSRAELDLLNGFAQQTGLAFEQTALRRARELAATDSLTGLANHRAFRDALGGRLSEARRHGGDVSILFCDLDNFKAVNDRFGHAAGDQLLHRVSEAIRGAAREEDMVARYGGDEIALLLPGTGRFGALDLARRLRTQVLAVEAGMGIDLTVGVAVFPEDAGEPHSLVARADAAMYAGKRLGGGRVVLASELPAEA